MPATEHFEKLARMYLNAPCNRPLGLAMHIEEGRATVSLDVVPAYHHAANALHGSYYFKLLDDAAFFAANSLEPDVFVLTTSFNVHLLSPVVEGRIEAKGHVVRAGRQLIFADSILRDADGNELARGTGVFARSRQALSPEIGYR